MGNLIIGSVILLFGSIASIGLRSCYSAVSPPSAPTSEMEAERSRKATTAFQSGLETQRKNLEIQRKQRVVSGITDAKKVLASRAPCSQTATPGALYSLSQAREGEPEWAEASALLAKLEPCRKQIQKNARPTPTPKPKKLSAADCKIQVEMHLTFCLAGVKIVRDKYAGLAALFPNTVPPDDVAAEFKEAGDRCDEFVRQDRAAGCLLP